MHMKYEIGKDIKSTLSTMIMRAINKVLPLMSSVPNVVKIPEGLQLQVFNKPSKIGQEDTFLGDNRGW
jgi:hypothetical protein